MGPVLPQQRWRQSRNNSSASKPTACAAPSPPQTMPPANRRWRKLLATSWVTRRCDDGTRLSHRSRTAGKPAATCLHLVQQKQTTVWRPYVVSHFLPLGLRLAADRGCSMLHRANTSILFFLNLSRSKRDLFGHPERNQYLEQCCRIRAKHKPAFRRIPAASERSDFDVQGVECNRHSLQQAKC